MSNQYDTNILSECSDIAENLDQVNYEVLQREAKILAEITLLGNSSIDSKCKMKQKTHFAKKSQCQHGHSPLPKEAKSLQKKICSLVAA